MARIVFTAVRTKQFRAQLMEIQQRLQEFADTMRSSPKSKPYVAAALAKFSPLAGLAGLLNGAAVSVVDTTAVANGTSAGTAAVSAAGVLTQVNTPTTDKIVKSGVKYLMPVATGSYVNGYTFTVVNGVITAAVAS